VPLASRTWAGVLPALAERGRTAVAVDLVGMGESDKPLSFAYTLDGLTGLLEGLLAQLAGDGGPWLLAGHDLGGLLALRLAARHPQLVAGAAAFDATASLHHPFPWITLFATRPSALAGVFRLGQPAGLRSALRPLWRPGAQPPEELVAAGAQAFARPEAVWALARLIEGVANTPTEELEAVRAEIGGYQGPVLLARGAEDTALPAEAGRDLAALLPQAREAAVPEAGHLSPLERPEAVAELLAGWASPGGAR
jgi:pimeloyl-ACP methyl ester carboxylesterase